MSANQDEIQLLPDASVNQLTVVIATAGRDSLRDTLASLRGQLHVQDRVEVVVDGVPTESIYDVWREAALPGSLTIFDEGPHHDWGHTPRNRALLAIRDGYVYHLDDDDITVPQSLEIIREEIQCNPGAFFFFRVAYPDEASFSWSEHRIERGWVGTGIFVHPAGIPLGRFGSSYTGDFDFIEQTLNLNPDCPLVWVDRVIGIIEPYRWTKSYKTCFTDEAPGRHIILRGAGLTEDERSREIDGGDQNQNGHQNLSAPLPTNPRRPTANQRQSETGVLLTSYLTAQADHHHKQQFPSDAPELLLLAKTAEQQEVDCLIFYDALSERFVREHTSSYVTFVKVSPPQNISNNGYRLFLYRDWLAWHCYESVWCCDLFDVRLNRDPASLLDEQHDLWIGVHRNWTVSESSEVGRCITKDLLRFLPEVPEVVRDKPVLMAGTFGGYFKPVKYFLELLTAEYERCAPGDRNCNLPLFNLVAYRDLCRLKLWTKGAPLHSESCAYDLHADVCFVHK